MRRLRKHIHPTIWASLLALPICATGSPALGAYLGRGEWRGIARPMIANQGSETCLWLRFDREDVATFGSAVNLGEEIGDWVCSGSTSYAPPSVGYERLSSLSCRPAKTGSLKLSESLFSQGSDSSGGYWNTRTSGTLDGTIRNRLGLQSAVIDGRFVRAAGNVSTEDLGPCGRLDGDGVLKAAGYFTFNGFRSVPTDAGSNVSVSTTATYVNPVTGGQTDARVDVGFAHVEVAGETTVSAVSATDGGLAANFAPDAGGFRPTYLDVSTSATYAPPLTICTSYEDADNDGVIDGTSVPESALSFLHQENGTFIDRTSSRDPVANRICAQVESLSYVTAMVRLTGICRAPGQACDDGNACTTGEACDVNLHCQGGNPVDCDDGIDCSLDTCVAPGGCKHTAPPAPDCLDGERSQLVLSNQPPKLGLLWQGNLEGTSLGTPYDGDALALCLYDSNGLLATASAPSGCDSDSCWSSTKSGFKFRSKTARDGLSEVILAVGDAGRAKLRVKGTGAGRDPGRDPTRSRAILAPPVEIRFFDRQGSFCARGAFAGGDVSRNDRKKFVANRKSP